jgi:hypothetical protein
MSFESSIKVGAFNFHRGYSARKVDKTYSAMLARTTRKRSRINQFGYTSTPCASSSAG